jgi:hypothetical protein
MPFGLGQCNQTGGKALTVEERPSGMADKGKEVWGPPKKDRRLHRRTQPSEECAKEGTVSRGLSRRLNECPAG